MKVFTKMWTMLLLLCFLGVTNANAALIKPTVGITERFTSVADLTGKTFAIVNEAEGKALYGSNNQNLAYDVYSTAFSSSNSGYLWKLVSLAEDADAEVHDYYRFQLVTPTGADYNCWGMGGWLNSQPATGGCSFILGLNNQNGQDIPNGAVYDVQYVEGQGFSMKNVGTGLYQGANTLPANNEDPFYFTFATVSETYVPAVQELLAEGEQWKAIVTDADALAAYDAAIAGIDPANIEGNGLAEAKIIDAAITALVKAQPAVNGADFTRAIVNPSFENGNIEGWVSNNGGGAANNGNFAAATGSFFVERWTGAPNTLTDGSLNQVIAGLPAGKYKLTAEMQNLEQGNENANGTGYYLFANADSVAVATAGETVVVETELTEGDLTIGAAIKGCSGNWVCVDNFKLTYVKEDTPAGNEITIVPGDLTAIEGSAFESTQGDVTIRCTNGTVTADQIRVFKGQTISFEGTKNIEKIVFTCTANGTAKYGPGCFNAQEGYTFEADGKTGTWEGSAATVEFTAESNQVRISEIKITLGNETVEPVHIANTAETAYTVAKAIELIEAGKALTDVVFVKGIVSQVDKIQDGAINYWISDDGTTANQFECYKGKGIDGADFASIDDVEVGAEVIVTGTMKKYVPAEGDPIYEFNAGNALVTYVAPVKPLFADGKYYILNKGTQKYLAAGAAWGTHAVVNADGLDYAIAFADGLYTLDSNVSNGGNSHFLNGEWNDGAAMGWIFTPVEGAEGLYTISNGTNFLTAQENGEVLLKDNAANDSAIWILKTPAERIAELANATAENPVDATFLLADANFNRNDLRVSAWKGDSFGVGGENTNMNAEKWGGNSQEFDVHQQIALPNGLYKITWNGFYRYNNTTDNTNDVAAAAHADSTEVINSFVYLNDKDFALTSIADEAAVEAYGKMPFSQKEATAAFEMGLYEQTAEIEVANDSLTVGIKKIAHMGTDWTVWDNFRLSYLGVPVVINPDKEEIAVPEGMINLIANGNLAGDDVTSFVAKEAPSDAIVGATIVAGAGENNSRGIVVKSADEVDKEGAQDWDSQFWISLSEPLADGAKLHVEFDYAANKAAKASTQAHGAPGAYQHWAAIGDVNFTTEWQHFSADVTVEGAMANMQSIAFNLAVERTATEYYFDNFGVWYEKPAPVEQWTDLIVNGNMEGESFECFYVTEQNVGGPYVAIATEGIGKDGSKAVKVQSADDPAQDWDSQFFIRLPYQLPAGTKYRVSFDYKADKEGEFDTQAHTEPGGYIHWAAIGNGKFTTEWQTYEQSGSISSDMSKEGQIMQTIAFNLAKNKVATEFIFDNVKFEVPSDVAATLTKNPAVDPKPYPVGIQTVNIEKNAEGVFNLNGQKVMKTQKGLYIMNGKKVVIK